MHASIEVLSLTAELPILFTPSELYSMYMHLVEFGSIRQELMKRLELLEMVANRISQEGDRRLTPGSTNSETRD